MPMPWLHDRSSSSLFLSGTGAEGGSGLRGSSDVGHGRLSLSAASLSVSMSDAGHGGRERARVPSGTRFSSAAFGREVEQRGRVDSADKLVSPTSLARRPALAVVTPASKVGIVLSPRAD